MYEWLNDTVLIECTEHFVIVGTGNEINQFGGGLTEVNAIETRTRNAAGTPISQPQATLPPPPQPTPRVDPRWRRSSHRFLLIDPRY